MRFAAVAIGVFGLLLLGFLTAKVASRKGASCWKDSEVYAVWCVGAEVPPTRADGSPWDEDGSPPDLSAEITWRGNRVLRSATSRNTLVASWVRSSLELTDFLRKEFRPGDLDKVARIKAEPSEVIAVDLFDRDLFGSEFIGKVLVPVGCLREGINRVVAKDPRAGMLSVSLQVVPAGTLERGGQIPDNVRMLQLDDAQQTQ